MRVAVFIGSLALAFVLGTALSSTLAGGEAEKMSLIVKRPPNANGVMILEPITPVLLGVTVENGGAGIVEGDALDCKMEGRQIGVLADEKTAKMMVIVLDCGKTVLDVRQLGTELPPRPEPRQ